MGIGWNGKSLREMLDEYEAKSESGYYYGIEELKLREDDFFKYERFYYRLLNATLEARERVKFACASPGTRELGELLFLVHAPEGEAAAISLGLMAHVTVVENVIKTIIRENYEETVGIRDGDIFVDNDPYTGGAHPADSRLIVPVFHEGELICWVGSISHELEIGGGTPGSFNPFAVESFTCGERISVERVGEKNQFYPWFIRRLRRNSRAPDLWILDERAKLSGCLIIKERIKEIIEEFGVDYFKQALRELIEEGRRDMEARIKRQLVPGKYRIPHFCPVLYKGEGVPPHADRDYIIHLPLEIEITPEAKIIFSYEGASRWGWHSFNMYPGALESALWLSLIETLLYDGRVTSGGKLQTELIRPIGSITNPDYPYAGDGIPWVILTGEISMSSLAIYLAQFARGYIEECIEIGANWASLEGGGITRFGTSFGFTNFEFSACAQGARPIEDGLVAAAAPWMPETDTGNAEIWEIVLNTASYLYRGVIRNSCGHGKFIGGPAWGSLWVSWKPTVFTIVASGSFSGMISYQPFGLMGGYPAPSWSFFIIRNPEIFEKISNGEIYPGIVELFEHTKNKGLDEEIEVRKGFANSRMAQDRSIFGIIYGGGVGYGDPIERDPEKVAEDVNNGIITEEVAKNVYGVVLEYDESKGVYSVNPDETVEMRSKIRENRKKRGRPVKEWWMEERKKIKEGKLPPYAIEMYKECIEFSEKFRDEFTKFWQISEKDIMG